MKNIFTLMLALLLVGSSFGQNQMVIRIQDANQKNYDYFNKNNDEITAYRSGQYLDVLVSQERYQDLQNAGWNMQITQTTQQNIQNLNANKDINGYHTYDEALAVLQQIASDYPEICTLTDIADSHGKEYFNDGAIGYEDYQHDIWMLKISDNVNETEDEPSVFFMGAHHAREPISTEVVLGIIQHLTENYGINDEVTTMVDNAEIYIIPIVNPDGHKVVLDQLNTWWRKNAADNDGNGQFSNYSDGPDGVDPNRNYGWNFGGTGSSGNPSNDIYHGPYAFSEPELAAVRDMFNEHHFTSGITYHSYSELVLYPFGYSETCVAPDNDALEELAVNMAESIPKISGSGHYFPEQSKDLYPASGVTDDWAYGNHGIFCYTVELGQEFIPSATQVPTIIGDNIAAAMMVLNRANHQTLRGHIYDAQTEEPIIGEIFIEGIDGTESFREPYRSSPEYGAYYRLLMSGNVNARFSAYGCISQNVSDIEILADDATILDVYLERAPAGPVMGSVLDGVTGDNIEGAEVSFLNTPVLPVYTDANGVYEVLEVSYDAYTVRVSKEGYAPLYIEQTITEEQNTINFVLLPAEAITFEEGVFDDTFSMGGNLDWQIDENTAYEGDYSAASGNISDNQTSSMILNSENRAAGGISFFTKVSTEGSYDFLKFYVDNVEQGSWSGEVDWEAVEFQISEGDHEFKWTFNKDESVANGSDKTWVDFIQLPPALTTVVNAGPDQTIDPSAEAILNAYASNYTTISWTSSGDGSFSNAEDTYSIYSPGANDIINGSVELSLTATGSQTVTDQLILTLEVATGIIQQIEQAGFVLSPNPTDKNVNINLVNDEGGLIEIYNISGLILQKLNIPKGQKQVNVDVAHLPSGVYFVKYTSNEGLVSIERLLVK